MHFVVALWLAIASFTTVVQVDRLETFDDAGRHAVVACEADGSATITWAAFPTLEEWAERFREAASCADARGVRPVTPQDVTCSDVEGVTVCTGTLH